MECTATDTDARCGHAAAAGKQRSGNDRPVLRTELPSDRWQDGLRALLERSRLRAVLVSVGDLDTARDLVDKAFARAWASWRTVSRHPAPGGPTG